MHKYTLTLHIILTWLGCLFPRTNGAQNKLNQNVRRVLRKGHCQGTKYFRKVTEEKGASFLLWNEPLTLNLLSLSYLRGVAHSSVSNMGGGGWVCFSVGSPCLILSSQPSDGLLFACQTKEFSSVTRGHRDTEDMTPALADSQKYLNTGILEMARF